MDQQTEHALYFNKPHDQICVPKGDVDLCFFNSTHPGPHDISCKIKVQLKNSDVPLPKSPLTLTALK